MTIAKRGIVVIKRLISSSPIESKYSGVCSVCKMSINIGDNISPYFDGDKNMWRHTSCLQLFFLERFIYEGICKDCEAEIEVYESGYWSKHNGVWCSPCGEKLFPKTHISFSRFQRDNNLKSIKKKLGS